MKSTSIANILCICPWAAAVSLADTKKEIDGEKAVAIATDYLVRMLMAVRYRLDSAQVSREGGR